jgi:hypothetical protein
MCDLTFEDATKENPKKRSYMREHESVKWVDYLISMG